MSADAASQPESVTATLDLTIAGRPGRLEIPVPTAPMRAVELLPLLQSLTDTLVNIATENVEADGARVSCRKGCGACCRQLVPISEIEVESIRRVVGELPEARRATVIARFVEARRRLEASGLYEPLQAAQRIAREDLAPLGIAYFEQGIACPFLEDESCSIHADRPLSCREYLVVSPAVNCTKPSPSTIELVPMPLKVSNAAKHLESPRPGVVPSWIPLILALEWPVTVRESVAPMPGTAMMVNVLTHLFGRTIPLPGSDAAKTCMTSSEHDGSQGA
jgi:Fe-S-cluster containining protein